MASDPRMADSELDCTACGAITLQYSLFYEPGTKNIIDDMRAYTEHWAREHEIRHAEGFPRAFKCDPPCRATVTVVRMGSGRS